MKENEKEIAKLILGILENHERNSTLQLALECARFHLGIKKNEKPNYNAFQSRHNFVEKILHDNKKQSSYEDLDMVSDNAEIFSALMLYLNVLEQIGTLFCKTSKKKYCPIINAITDFYPKEMQDKEKQAIKNLRNSLAHNFGLVNLKGKSPTHKYTICFQNEGKKIIELPKTKWNKDYTDQSEKTSCLVYAFPLMTLVEDILSEIIKKYKQNKLKFAMPIEEVKSRFTVLN